MTQSEGSTSASIIIVEDERIAAMDIRRQLLELGYSVPSTASSGDEAIAMVAKFMPDLVLMDIVLRGKMDGIEVADRIRREFDIPVIFLTAFADEESLRRAKMTEPSGYLLKPFEERELRTTIEMALYKNEAQRKLREASAFNRSLLQTIPFGMHIVDEHGNILYINDRMRTLFTTASPGQKCWEACKADGRQCDQCPLKSGIEVGMTERIEVPGMRGNRTFLISHTGMEYNGTKAVLEIFQDVTADKHDKERINMLAHAIRSIGEAVSITDLDNTILYVNDTFLKMYGYEEQELIGKSISIVKSAGKSAVQASTILDETFGRGWQGELVNKRKDGTRFPISLSTSVVRDEDGKAVGLMGVARDISRREQAEKQLRQLSRAVEQSPASIIITDVSGAIEYVNRKFTQVTGFTFEEVAGKNPRILKSGTTPPEMYRDLWATIGSGAEWQGELQNRKKNGDLYWEFASISPVYDNEGQITHFLAVKEDITSLKQMELQLRQAQKMESMGVLVGGISHDFNNILNNVLGFVHQLRKNAHVQAKVVKYADTIEKSAMRGAELATQLLSFVRQNKQEPEPVNIDVLVDEVAALLRETLPKNVIFERKSCTQPLVARGIHGELYQVLLNLCVNARDAMPEGGRLLIETQITTATEELTNAIVASPVPAGHPCIQISVTDSGTGIPEIIRDKIFDPLFTTKDRGRGTGLGLSVVYNIVKHHKGTIVVKSEEGKGSSFTIYLPSMDVEKGDDRLGEDQPSIVKRSDKLILLVDDETPMVELGKELLEDEGYGVVTAGDGLDALEIYRHRWKEIGLVVLDLVMPRMDGGQAYLEMKKINPDLKAFFCTGYSSDQVITSLLAEERLEALQKPFRPKEFTKMVREKLGV